MQTQSRQSELRVARLDDLDREKQLQLQALLAQYTERSFAIVLQSVDTLPLTSGAKRHFTLNLYDAA